MKTKSKRAAMEMSVGTIVTIVLLMSVLVLGIFFVQKIFITSNKAIESVDSQIQSQINQLFSTEGNLVIFPDSREITMKPGSVPAGFAFSLRNDDVQQHSYKYSVESEPDFDFNKCGTLTKRTADNWIIISSGSLSLAAGAILERSEIPLVKFQIPSSAPPCTIPFLLEIERDGEFYKQSSVYLTIK